MHKIFSLKAWATAVALCWVSIGAHGSDLVEHQLSVGLFPDAHRLAVVDTVVLPEGYRGPVAFRLHPGLEPRVLDPGIGLQPARRHELAQWAGNGSGSAIAAEHFEVDLPAGARQFTLRYEGSIHHPVRDQGHEHARSFGTSPGLIGPEGVFLAGASLWYPQIDGPEIAFRLEARLPVGWRSVSQGKRLRQSLKPEGTEEAWSEIHPQEEIYLIAAPYSEYRDSGSGIEAMVFLREPDAGLARRYLDATLRYVEMYRQLIGPYPYSKFALVESFWESGYGMPSFTLLGPRVIRLPFIIVSSYPHEILHNWWGNGVYVDYACGNWSEGLTSYLADHLLKEQRREGAEYRHTTLQGYADYVRGGKDFPLVEFRARHSSSTQAVGYGKALMFFHMLRREIGDAAFVEGLRRFYREHRYRPASFADLEESFSAAASRPLDGFFEQWVQRTGAPVLRLSEARAEPEGDGFRLTARLEQVQGGLPYALSVPLAVTLEGQPQALETQVELRSERGSVDLALPKRPLRLDVDPDFDLFRRLNREETPPALSQALGADRALIVLPERAPPELLEQYRELAQTWGRGRELEVRLDSEIEALPSDRAVWLLGWKNRFRPVLADVLGGYPFADRREGLTVAGERIDPADHCVVVVGRHPGNSDQAIVWVASAKAAAIPGLARKLPHYGKYSYLAFAGEEPANTLKGQWPVVASPLSAQLGPPGERSIPAAKRVPREPLAQLPRDLSEGRMRGVVERLSSEEMEGRGFGTPGLDRAAKYVAKQLAEAGLRPAGDEAGDWFQRFRARGGPDQREQTLRNVIGLVPGSHAEWSGQSVVIGAHYDHLGRGWPDVHRGDEGRIHPGADDNASGVAVLLALARHFARAGSERTLVFAAFAGEEAGRLGSRHFVERAAEDPDRSIRAMINLDTVGRLGDRELLVLGTGSAREWEHIFHGAGYLTGVRVRGMADDLGSSDQKSFLDAGIPAVQLFAGAHADYHRPLDTADKVDTAGLVKVGRVAKEAIEYLGQRPEPLSAQRSPPTAGGKSAPVVSGGRRASLGTVPDFRFAGPGVRLDGVGPGSPAEQAGLAAGDVIIAIGPNPVASLRDLARALRRLDAGDTIGVRFLRDGVEKVVEATVVAR